ncbi:hypothetical protein EMIT0111MI5_120055 [Burkholderia sp. IT-111MI5]
MTGKLDKTTDITTYGVGREKSGRAASGRNGQHKRKCPHKAGTFVCLAERTGLEPATPGVTGRYSNRLNYRSLVWLNQKTGGC